MQLKRIAAALLTFTACFAPVVEAPDMATTSGSSTNAGAGGGPAGGAGGAGGGTGGSAGGGSAGGMSSGVDAGTPLRGLGSGVRLAFDSNRAPGNRDLYLLTDATLERLTDDPAEDLEPAFSYDGQKLAFASDRAGGRREIFVMELASRRTTQLTTTGGDQPSWSPGGDRIVFHGLDGIYTIGTDGSGLQLVISGPGMGLGNQWENPVFTHDNLLLIDRHNQISLVTLAGAELRYVVHNWTTTIKAPAISPDGTQVAYAVWCIEDTGTQIRIVDFAPVNTPCSAGRDLTPSVARHPTWGASHLAWESGGDLWVVPDDDTGRAPINLTASPAADDRNPAFPPVP